MKKGVPLLMALLLSGFLCFGQLTGVKTIPGDYPSLATAISALNTSGAGTGGVTFNIAAGYSETFTSLTAGLITTNTGSVTNPILFQKDGTGANPLIKGYATAPGTTDYVICIAGTDYVTFDRIDVQELSGTIEWGYAVLKGSVSDGTQNLTIKNCGITLNKANMASIGIYSNNVTPAAPTTQLSISVFGATNSNNKFFGNTISNCYSGIHLYGFADNATPFVLYDQNNEVGKDGPNTITDFGGSTAAKFGIYTYYQNGLKIANNIITGTVAGTGACSGIQLFSANNASVDIYNNTVSLQYSGTGTFYGIYTNMGTTFTTNSHNIYDNIVTNCTYTTATSGTCYYLYAATSALNLNVYNNQITNNTYGSLTTTSTGTIYGIYYAGVPATLATSNFYGNVVSGNTRLQSVVGSGTNYYMYIGGGGTAQTTNVYNNTISNNTAASTGTTSGFYFLNSAITKNLYNNTVTGILNSRGTIYGIYCGNGTYTNVYGNKLQNFSSVGTSGTVNGIRLSSSREGGVMQVYNNMIGELKTPAITSGTAIYGISANPSSTNYVDVFNNTVYLDGTSTGTDFGSAALFIGSSPGSVEIRNNILINNTTPTGTGLAVAMLSNTTTLLGMSALNNNNNYYAGIPSATHLVYYDGTTGDQTLSEFKNRVWPRENQSLTENSPFLNTAASPYNLHMNPLELSQCESAGQIISGTPAITTDIDNNPRYPNPGYPDNPTYPAVAPDLGADEFGGIPSDITGPAILYSPLLNTSSLTARTLTATIRDPHGVPTSGVGLPRIAWKKFYNGTWNYATGVQAGGDQYNFTFAGGVALSDTIYYYVVAQDNFTTPAVGSYPFLGGAGYSPNPPAMSTPPNPLFKYTIVQGLCGTYNVGAGQTYATLTAAITDVNAKEITCPVTLLLTDNNYPAETYPIIINQIAGASSTNTLTIKPAPGVTPLIPSSYAGVSPNYWSTISLNGARFVIFDGSNSGGSDRSLIITNSAGGGFAGAIGLYNNGTAGASDIVIKNCVIQAHMDNAYNAQGILFYTITGNAGYNNVLINNNTVNSAKYGIQVTGIASNPASNVQVTNNTIGSMTTGSAVVQTGIAISYADNVLIEGNEIIGQSTGMVCAGGPMGVSVTSGSTHIKISKNIIHDWWQLGTAFPYGGATGIYIYGDALVPVEVSDNVIYNIKSPSQSATVTGANPFGIYVFKVGNVKIWHNTVYMGGNYLSSTVAGMSSCIGMGNNLAQMDIRDNILKNSSQTVSGTPSSKSYCITAGTGTPLAMVNNNDYFSDGIGSLIGYYNASDRSTLADWQTATGQDLNSVSIDPVFTSNTNFLPTTTLMPHAGVYIPAVPTDINGVNRTNPPDIGAYEFTVNPQITTTSASAITNAGALLNGNVIAAGTTINLFFDWGLTSAYGNTLSATPSTATGNTLTFMSAPIAGLTGNTTYHFRARGVTSGGVTVYGFDITFTTLPDPPSVVTTVATGITSSGATLNGTVNANGASTTASFEWGLTTAYGNTASAIPATVTGSVVTPISAALTGLQPNTTYHYRARGVNSTGTSYGADLTFTTSAIPATVVTNFASGVGTTTATVNGTVTANNAAATVSFQWGLTTSYGNTATATPATVNGMTATAVLANLSGLSINTTYHFRCVGVNAAGTTYGLDQTFNTNCVAPVITISGPSNACTGIAGNVYTTQSGMTGYAWTVSAGGIITAGSGTNAITVTWNTAGPQTVSVNYQNSFGCSAATPAIYNVAVTASPVPTITGSATACHTTTNNTYTTQAGMIGYTWSVSAGGTITAGTGTNAITVTWNNTGAQTVSVNYTNAGGCSAPAPVVFNVTVNALPAPTITGQNSVCDNSGYIAYSTETGMTGYTWTVSAGGTISAGQGTSTVQVTWTTAGAQTVSVNYLNANGCSATTPTVYNVTVNAAPGAAGSITGTPAVCGGAMGVAYSCAAIPGTAYYVWTLPAGATIATGSGTSSITVDFAANATSGDITVYGNNLCGNGASSPAFPVTVAALPAAAGTITGDNAVCQGTSGVIFTVATIANATTYNWTVPAGAAIVSGGTTSTITVDFGMTAASGNVTVYGSNACGNGTVSPNFLVAVFPIPAAPEVTAIGMNLTSSAPEGNQWFFEGALIPGATGQTYEAAQTGWYWAVVNLNGCNSDTSNHVYVLITGKEELQTGTITIYPVPNQGRFTVSIVSPSQDVFIVSVYNSLGETIQEVRDIRVNGRHDQNIDLGLAATGIYTVVIRNGNGHLTRKVVVNRK